MVREEPSVPEIRVDVNQVDRIYYDRFVENLRHSLDNVDPSLIASERKKAEDKAQELSSKHSQWEEYYEFAEALNTLSKLKELKNWEEEFKRVISAQKFTLQHVQNRAYQEYHGSKHGSEKDHLWNALNSLANAVDRLTILAQSPDDTESVPQAAREIRDKLKRIQASKE